MFKLTVVSGPNMGTTYVMKQGEVIVGRGSDCNFVLSSGRVSKKHCSFVVDETGVTVKDLGSSNGTFVNGLLVKSRKLNSGDRVSVGEFVLELTPHVLSFAGVPSVPMSTRSGVNGNVIPMPAMGNIQSAPLPGAPLLSGGGNTGGIPLPGMEAASSIEPPKNLIERLKFLFEKHVINFIYNLNEKQEWNHIIVGMFAILAFVAALVSVNPVLDRVTEKLEHEARERALLIARQLVDRNSQFVYERQETKVDVGFAEREKGVLGAYVVDMEGRILAPGRRANQYLSEGHEGAFCALARKAFAENEKSEQRWRVYGDMIGVAVPLRVFSASSGKNVTVALGIVYFDQSLILFDAGTVMLAYINALVLCAIAALIIYFSLYRLTLRPLDQVNEEIDQVLKGNATSVSKKFKMEEISPLIDVINAALQRIPSSGGGAANAQTDALNLDEVGAVLRLMADHMDTVGVVLLSPDKRIIHINARMEEITGIRGAMAVGDELANAARDAAFHSFVEDMLGRSQMSSEILGEDFEFSGTTYRVECVGLGAPGSYKAYVLMASKGA